MANITLTCVNNAGNITITPNDGGAGGNFNPASAIVTAGNGTPVFGYTPAFGAAGGAYNLTLPVGDHGEPEYVSASKRPVPKSVPGTVISVNIEYPFHLASTIFMIVKPLRTRIETFLPLVVSPNEVGVATYTTTGSDFTATAGLYFIKAQLNEAGIVYYSRPITIEVR